MKWNELQDQECPVPRALSVVGGRWTILIIRDCFLGIRKFDDFQKSLGMTRHVLADRLKKLQEDGFLKRVPYQEKPVRYEYRLTEMGRDFYPTMIVMMDWADKYVPAEKTVTFETRSKATGKAVSPVVIDRNDNCEITCHSVIRKNMDVS